MKVLVIRHAIAEERKPSARRGADQDARRPLTRQGRRRMRRGAAGLRRLVPDINLLATSPLTRATQTAEIVTKAYEGKVRAVQIPHLAPSKSVSAVMHWLGSQKPGQQTIALVGHEPHLSTFVSWALTGLQESVIVLKKGGAVMLEFEKDVKAGRAKLLWALKPSQLRGLVD